ncbi:hypothetical protein ACFL4B_00425 [Candidatus Neomarinimicrobiota bacterium]
MGFDTNAVKLLIESRDAGVNFEKIITIGRQGLHLSRYDANEILTSMGFTKNESNNIFSNNSFSEPFLELLGAEYIDSIDATDYEGATITHDLNLPIPDKLKSKYSLVIDSGSLEHIFNFPIAIKNCMELIKKNGYYLGITPTNNLLGHGFYQFSPELFYRCFNESNGFKIIKMYFFIDKKNASFYEVIDPFLVNDRVTLTNSYSSYIYILAQRIKMVKIFEKIPQQNYYENVVWKIGHYPIEHVNSKISSVKKYITTIVKKPFRIIYNLYKLLYLSIGTANQNYFKKRKTNNRE